MPRFEARSGRGVETCLHLLKGAPCGAPGGLAAPPGCGVAAGPVGRPPPALPAHPRALAEELTAVRGWCVVAGADGLRGF